jgi:hypothetical protein
MTAGQSLPREQQEVGLGLLVTLVDMFRSGNLNECSAIERFRLYAHRFGQNQLSLFPIEHENINPNGMAVAGPVRGSHSGGVVSN